MLGVFDFGNGEGVILFFGDLDIDIGVCVELIVFDGWFVILSDCWENYFNFFSFDYLRMIVKGFYM